MRYSMLKIAASQGSSRPIEMKSVRRVNVQAKQLCCTYVARHTPPESSACRREKLASSEERRRRAERARGDVQRALAAAVDANR